MNVAIVTSIRAPYRTIQFNEIGKDKNINLNVYYISKGKEDRNWETSDSEGFKEKYLKKYTRISNLLGDYNSGLNSLVTKNDIVFIGGYEKPTYIILSLLCRYYKKPYVIIYDGISCDRLVKKENKIKKVIKNIVIKHSIYIWGNGTVTCRYFNEVFNYPKERIYNQYLTVDGDKIKILSQNKENIRHEYREKYNLGKYEKVLQYSGRLIEIKNVKAVIEAIGEIKSINITLLITGDGIEQESLKKLAEEKNVKVIFTGFINKQEELFKHYFISDVFILPSIYEAWGLVVNEAMYASLPVLVSEICGCSLDLVKEGINGYVFNPYKVEELRGKIEKIFSNSNLEEMGKESLKIVNEYSFMESRNTFKKILNKCV